MQGNVLVSLVMYGWIPALFYLFTRFPAQRALIAGFIVAWLFLPLAELKFPGIPAYNKMSATCYGILLTTAFYDLERISAFKPGWLDVPMLIWSICPFFSSITNDLTPYDGFSATLTQAMTWGVPYFLGRVYLNDLAGLRQLAIGIFMGGLAYIPFCLFEIRMSPQLHLKVYGFNTIENFAQTVRYGGYRPQVFMNNGLMVGVWMMTATLMGIWLWRAGIIKKVGKFPVTLLVPVLMFTFILCKSTGAYTLLALGLIFLFTGKWLRTAFPVFLLIVGMSSYLYMGVVGTFTGEQRIQVIDFVTKATNPERAQSLDFRFKNEEILGNKARQSLIFGWGGYGRNRVYDENGKDITVTDSLWIIAFGTFGVVGLSSVTASLLLPVVGFCFRYPASTWSNPKIAPAAALAVSLTLYMLDCILNAMINPIFALTAGGLSGLLLKEAGTDKVIERSLSQRRQQRLN